MSGFFSSSVYIEHLKIVWSETTEPRVYIWHVASSGRLTKFIENYGWGRFRDQCFIYSLYFTHSCQILKGLIFDICYTTKFVQIIDLWSKWHRPGGHRVYDAVIVHWLFLSVPCLCVWHFLVIHLFLHWLTYSENIKKSSCLKLPGLEPWYLVCSISW